MTSDDAVLASSRTQAAPDAVLAMLAYAAPLVAATVLAFRSGGYFLADWGAAAICLLGLLIVVMLVSPGSPGGRCGHVALAGWGALAAWQGISSAWAAQPSGAMGTMYLTVLYATAFALVLVGLRRVDDLSRLMALTVVGCAAVVAYSLAARLLPGVIDDDAGGRLATPISYWNGLAVIAGTGAILAIGAAGDAGRRLRWRAAHAALVPAFLLTLLLTFSRGGAVAFVVALGVMVAIAPGRLETIASAVVSLAVSLPMLVIANGEGAIATLTPPLPPHEAEGRRILVILLVTVAASAVACLGTSAAMARLPVGARRPVGVATGATAVVLLGLALAAPAGGPVAWADRQFDSFRSYDVAARDQAESVTERLTIAAGTGRWQNWTVAIDEFRAAPLRGSGAGDYRFSWESGRDIDLTVRNAHSLYLETLGETGLIGLLLLLVPAGAVAVAVVLVLRAAAPPGTVRDIGTAVAAGGLVVVHFAGDWAWQLPGVALPGVVLGAGALKCAELARGQGARPSGLVARCVIGAGAGIAALLLAGAVASQSSLDASRAMAARGELAPALERARQAQRLNPQDPAARLLEANILTDLGRHTQADRAFTAAVARSPRDWIIMADWASAALRRGDTGQARLAAARARSLNPLEARPRLLIQAASNR